TISGPGIFLKPMSPGIKNNKGDYVKYNELLKNPNFTFSSITPTRIL
ncbi:unnamed protein product, partial [Brassica rapa subsp. trilocularis]